MTGREDVEIDFHGDGDKADSLAVRFSDDALVGVVLAFDDVCEEELSVCVCREVRLAVEDWDEVVMILDLRGEREGYRVRWVIGLGGL